MAATPAHPRRTRPWAAALSVLRRADEVFSTWRSDSEVSRLDRGELELDDCSPEVAEVLRVAEAATANADGAFDVWLPGPDGRVHLDPSGVVKGWAVARAALPLVELPGTDVCLSAGGDMVCHVADPDGPAWEIGVEDPRDPTRLVARVPVRRGAVATSGSAHRGTHVVDARTGRPVDALASVTVVGRDLTSVDIDATTALALGHDGPAWLRARGRVGVVVHADGRCELVG